MMPDSSLQVFQLRLQTPWSTDMLVSSCLLQITDPQNSWFAFATEFWDNVLHSIDIQHSEFLIFKDSYFKSSVLIKHLAIFLCVAKFSVFFFFCSIMALFLYVNILFSVSLYQLNLFVESDRSPNSTSLCIRNGICCLL